MKMAVSKRKIQANQKNALKSTGPKTQKGKSVVKWNAITHGLLAQEIIIKKGDGQEDHLEFKSLFTQLHEDLQPVGVLEEMLVERIAICYWRLRRVIRCEIGEIRKELDNIVWMDTNKKIDSFEFDKRFIELDEQRNNIRKTSYGINYLLEELDNIKALFEEVGYVSEDIRQKLIKYFGTDERSLTVSCLFVEKLYQQNMLETELKINNENKALPNKEKMFIVGLFDEQQKKLEKVKKLLHENEHNEIDAKWESLYLPSREAVDKILRYETTLERQLYRAIKQLELLQKKREYDFGFVS